MFQINGGDKFAHMYLVISSHRRAVVLYVSCISMIKFQIIKELKKSGLYKNSVILVTTDNGGGAPFSNR